MTISGNRTSEFNIYNTKASSESVTSSSYTDSLFHLGSVLILISHLCCSLLSDCYFSHFFFMFSSSFLILHTQLTLGEMHKSHSILLIRSLHSIISAEK
jgi:hypothetical protein